MTDREDHAEDGSRPTEEVGPSECDGTSDDVEHTVQDLAQDAEDHVEGTWRDEVAESFPVEPLNYAISPDDGMPTEAERVQLSTAPSLTRENVVCVEDDREYVEIFSEEIPGRRCCSQPEFHGLRLNVQSCFTSDGKLVERRRWLPDKVFARFGVKFAETQLGLVPVRPVRERCKHYKRQLWLNQEMSAGGQEVKVVSRNCMARRTVGGAFLSVSNEAIYACDYRDPPDPETVRKHLDEPDQKRLDAPAPEMIPLFAGGGGAGGIFAPK